jgi:hypothetical protein
MKEKQWELGRKPADCPKYLGCEAPLCPLDTGLTKGRWFPDEPLCRANEWQDLSWIKKQREVQRLLHRKSDPGFFTVKMLKVIAITPDLKGADPDEHGVARRHSGLSGKGVQKEQKPMSKTMLIAIEHDGDDADVFQRVEDALTRSKRGKTHVARITLFGEKRPKKRVAPQSANKQKTVTTKSGKDQPKNPSAHRRKDQDKTAKIRRSVDDTQGRFPSMT